MSTRGGDTGTCGTRVLARDPGPEPRVVVSPRQVRRECRRDQPGRLRQVRGGGEAGGRAEGVRAPAVQDPPRRGQESGHGPVLRLCILVQRLGGLGL